MSKFDDMIYGLKQDTEVPKDVWMKYTDTLSKLPDKPEERFPRTFSKRKIWPVAVAAALVVGTISVSAAAYIHWSKGLEERLQVTDEQRQTLEDNQMASSIGQSVTQGDVTVTVQQSIVDNYFAYLSFKVEGYEVKDGVQPDFSQVTIDVGEDGEHTGGWSSGFYNGLIQSADGTAIHADGTPLAQDEEISYTMDDGSLEYHVVMMSDEKGHYINKPIHVELKNLGIYEEKAGDPVVNAEGEWSFDWTLTGSDAMEKYELNTALEGSGAAVLRAELSPISVSVAYELPRQEITEQGIDENGEEFTHTSYQEPPAFTGVRMKDGTTYTSLRGVGISGYTAEDSDVYEYTAALEKAIDVDQVESLLFIKSYPEGEQPLTEENLYIVPVK